MQQLFLKYIQQEHLFNPKDKILITISGGIDSVVMCHLFHAAGLSFAIAHCNFQLRGDESDGDETFVKELAKKYNVAFHQIRFDTEAYVGQHKVSTQVAARELRYKWFEEIRKQNSYDFIATAHHQGDVIETFFINLIRGTGISGLRSIVPKQGKIIRPLLFTTRKNIVAYAEENKIAYREDSSNASDNYLRNKIRHHLIPVLNEFNPVAQSSIIHSIETLRAVEIIYKQTIEKLRSKICKEENNNICISISELKKLNPLNTYLFELLKPYGFNGVTVSDIVAILDGESGKQFFGSTHRLIKDRTYLILEPFQKVETPDMYFIADDQVDLKTPLLRLGFQTKLYTSESIFTKTDDVVMLYKDKLQFPLTLRKWKTGDAFHPLGMKGKKKLSDFFIDKKLSLIEKENTWLLCSGEDIVWVVGMRLDDRFKVTKETKTAFCVSLIR